MLYLCGGACCTKLRSRRPIFRQIFSISKNLSEYTTGESHILHFAKKSSDLSILPASFLEFSQKIKTKDFIAPPSFRFGEGRYFRMGRKIGAVSFLQILAPELNDRILADIFERQPYSDQEETV